MSMITRWLFSTNARDIGTLYFILALFSGLIGTAFSMLVRHCALYEFDVLYILQCLYLLTPSRLDKGESPELNIASSQKGCNIFNLDKIKTQGVISMAKAILPEPNSSDVSRKGLRHAWNRSYQDCIKRLTCLIQEESLSQVTRSYKVKSWEPKEIFNSQRELWDCLRERNSISYGNGVFIVPKLERKTGIILLKTNVKRIGFRYYATSNKGNLPRSFNKLVKFSNSSREAKITDSIYKLMFDYRMYEIAYHNLKSKPGNLTPGIIPETLDKFSMEWIDETIMLMKNEQFQFKPGRRVMIPKPNGGKRPLTVASPRDKIVQEVIRMILSAIFEPTFSENSHGFRPGRGCHSALRKIKTQFGATSWFIEGDISKCFDSFDYHILMKIIEEKITDRRFTNLIWKTLRAGYFEFKNYQHSISGTPQGSVISPILSNIYLDKLDEFIEFFQSKYNKGSEATRNPAWRKLEHLRAKAIKSGDNLIANSYLKKMQLIPSRLPNDPNLRRLYYVRYADDWIIGIRGTRTDAVNLLAQIKEFLKLELNLDLSDEKSKITNPRTDRALFLGTLIGISSHKYYYDGKSGTRLRSASQIRMLAPLDRIYEKLSQVNLMDRKNMKGSPKFLWLYNDKNEIITLYNAVLRGYLNYYSFVMNYGTLTASLTHILKVSCAKLLAAKFNLQRVSKVLGKFGPDLKGNDKVAFIKPPMKIKPWDFKVGTSDYIKIIFSSGLSAASLNNLSCTNCGSNYRVEMHHVRMLKDLNPNLSAIDRLMIKQKRKQIPLCRSCHLEHHRNKVKS
jgi:group II intron reverse transcriptase/maturase